jgi:hypothetical protein
MEDQEEEGEEEGEEEEEEEEEAVFIRDSMTKEKEEEAVCTGASITNEDSRNAHQKEAGRHTSLTTRLITCQVGYGSQRITVNRRH